MLYFVTPVLIMLVKLSNAVDPNCDYYQNIVLGQEYFIYNREYPYSYPKSTFCRWSGASPPGTIIVVNCNEVDLPYSRDCQKDRLIFSPDGNPNLEGNNNVEEYCGNTSFTTFTENNLLAMGLFSPSDSSGGRFVCSLAAMRVNQNNCDCGLHNEMKIVGGTETRMHEYPPMSALVDIQKNEAYCGSTIISNRHVLTAAHCLLQQTIANLRVLVGEHDLTKDDTRTAQKYIVENFFIHPYYDTSSQHNDIGVVRTLISIYFNYAVQPSCLPFRYRQYSFQGEVVTALGWGYLDFSGDKSSTLQKVDLDVISNSDCDAALTENIQLTQVCTYTPGKDACISDSGGPLLWGDRYSNSGKTYLIGVISFGLGCATSKPAVNTRVTSFFSWIASVTSDVTYCMK